MVRVRFRLIALSLYLVGGACGSVSDAASAMDADTGRAADARAVPDPTDGSDATTGDPFDDTATPRDGVEDVSPVPVDADRDATEVGAVDAARDAVDGDADVGTDAADDGPDGQEDTVADVLSDAAADAPPVPAGAWRCAVSDWSAETTVRTMEGDTQFECGWFRCGDASHSQPTTWVDIVGGLSQSCEDHSSSFYGPEEGEWNGCSAEYGAVTHQESRGPQPIEGLDQASDVWPTYWRDLASLHAPDTLAARLDDHREPLANPFATVYDLDFCWIRQLIGTIYYGDVPVVSRRASGDPLRPDLAPEVVWTLDGESEGVHCSQIEDDCTNVVCSDLRVHATFVCTWEGGAR